MSIGMPGGCYSLEEELHRSSEPREALESISPIRMPHVLSTEILEVTDPAKLEEEVIVLASPSQNTSGETWRVRMSPGYDIQVLPPNQIEGSDTGIPTRLRDSLKQRRSRRLDAIFPQLFEFKDHLDSTPHETNDDSTLPADLVSGWDFTQESELFASVAATTPQNPNTVCVPVEPTTSPSFLSNGLDAEVPSVTSPSASIPLPKDSMNGGDHAPPGPASPPVLSSSSLYPTVSNVDNPKPDFTVTRSSSLLSIPTPQQNFSTMSALPRTASSSHADSGSQTDSLLTPLTPVESVDEEDSESLSSTSIHDHLTTASAAIRGTENNEPPHADSCSQTDSLLTPRALPPVESVDQEDSESLMLSSTSIHDHLTTASAAIRGTENDEPSHADDSCGQTDSLLTPLTPVESADQEDSESLSSTSIHDHPTTASAAPPSKDDAHSHSHSHDPSDPNSHADVLEYLDSPPLLAPLSFPRSGLEDISLLLVLFPYSDWGRDVYVGPTTDTNVNGGVRKLGGSESSAGVSSAGQVRLPALEEGLGDGLAADDISSYSSRSTATSPSSSSSSSSSHAEKAIASAPALRRSQRARALSASKIERTSIMWAPHEGRYTLDAKGTGKARAYTHSRGVSDGNPRHVEREVQTTQAENLQAEYARLKSELRRERAKIAGLARERDEASLEAAFGGSESGASAGVSSALPTMEEGDGVVADDISSSSSRSTSSSSSSSSPSPSSSSSSSSSSSDARSNVEDLPPLPPLTRGSGDGGGAETEFAGEAGAAMGETSERNAGAAMGETSERDTDDDGWSTYSASDGNSSSHAPSVAGICPAAGLADVEDSLDEREKVEEEAEEVAAAAAKEEEEEEERDDTDRHSPANNIPDTAQPPVGSPPVLGRGASPLATEPAADCENDHDMDEREDVEEEMPERDEYPEHHGQVSGESAFEEESSSAAGAEPENRLGEHEVVGLEVAEDGEHQGTRADGSTSVLVDVPPVLDLSSAAWDAVHEGLAAEFVGGALGEDLGELDEDNDFADERTPELLPALHFPSPSLTEELLSSPEFAFRLDAEEAIASAPALPQSRRARALSASKIERTSILWAPHEGRYTSDAKGKGKARAHTHSRGVSGTNPRHVEQEVQTTQNDNIQAEYARLKSELRRERAKIAGLARERDEASLEAALSTSSGLFSWGFHFNHLSDAIY